MSVASQSNTSDVDSWSEGCTTESEGSTGLSLASDDDMDDSGTNCRRVQPRMPAPVFPHAQHGLRALHAACHAKLAAVPAEPEAGNAALPAWAALHPHQQQGVTWSVQRLRAWGGALVADAMGTGKTAQALATSAVLVRGPQPVTLVVCPLSVVQNWAAEAARWVPAATCTCIQGDASKRRQLLAAVAAPPLAETASQLVVCSYEVALQCCTQLGALRPALLIVDEAHRLKSRHSKLRQNLHAATAGTPRLLLTGTPIAGSAAELASLLSFAAPDIVADSDALAEEFVAAASAAATGAGAAGQPELAGVLRSVVQMAVLRRTLTDIGLTPPDITQEMLYAELTEVQRLWYTAVLQQHTRTLQAAVAHSASSADAALNAPLGNVLLQLRKVCNHPYLIPGAEPEPFEEGEHLVQACGKLRELDQLLQGLRADSAKLEEGGAEPHRVLLFSTSVRLLDILQDYVELRGWSWERLDGSLRGQERWHTVQRTQDGLSAPFIFLVSTRAGGVGLNLTAADTVVLYDADFTPAQDAQAISRAHRLGQTRTVRVIRLCTRGSVEEHLEQRAQRKAETAQAVLAGGAPRHRASLLRAICFGLREVVPANDASVTRTDEETLSAMLAKHVAAGAEAAGTTRPRRMPAPYVPAPLPARPKLTAEQRAARQTAARIKRWTAQDYVCQRAAPPAEAQEEAGHVPLPYCQAWQTAHTAPESIDSLTRWEGSAAEPRLPCIVGARAAPGLAHTAQQVLHTQMKRVPGLPSEHWSLAVQRQPGCRAHFLAVSLMLVDSSGEWARGGMFRALAGMPAVVEGYKAASLAKDLKLGDAHLWPAAAGVMELPGGGSVRVTHMAACLVAVVRPSAGLKRRHGQRPLLDLSAHEAALRSMADALQVVRGMDEAGRLHISLHSPRLGAEFSRHQYYALERIFCKHTIHAGLPAVVYYFRRPDPVPAPAPTPAQA